MLVRIRKDIFDNEAYSDELNNLLKYFRLGKHTLVIDDYDDINAFENSSWKKEINQRDLKVINASIRSATRKNTNRLLITVTETDTENNFRPREADKYLDQPLTVLLENSDYDPPFINAQIQLTNATFLSKLV